MISVPSKLEFILLYLAVPSKPERCVGVFVYSPIVDRLTWRLVEDWDFVSDDEIRGYLEAFTSELTSLVHEVGPSALLDLFQTVASNVLRTSDKEMCEWNKDQEAAVDWLFNRFVVG